MLHQTDLLPGGASVNTVRFQTSAAVAAIIKNVNRGNVWADFHRSCNLTASAGAADRWLFKFISLWGRSRLNQPANGLSKLSEVVVSGCKKAQLGHYKFHLETAQLYILVISAQLRQHYA